MYRALGCYCSCVKQENLENIFKAASVLKHKHGRMHLRIGKPISVRARAEGRVQRYKQALSPGSKPYDDATKEVVADIAYEVIASHQAIFIITMPAVLSTLVLYYTQLGIHRISLADLFNTVENAVTQVGLIFPFFYRAVLSDALFDCIQIAGLCDGRASYTHVLSTYVHLESPHKRSLFFWHTLESHHTITHICGDGVNTKKEARMPLHPHLFNFSLSVLGISQ